MKLPRIFWRFFALAALVGGALFNEKVLSRNPDLEQRLVGCWVGTTGSDSPFPRTVVFKFEANGTFTGRGVESLITNRKLSKAVRASGTWKVQRNKWTLQYTESTGILLFPRPGTEWNFKVFDVTDDALDARGWEANGRSFGLSRINPNSIQCVGEAEVSA